MTQDFLVLLAVTSGIAFVGIEVLRETQKQSRRWRTDRECDYVAGAIYAATVIAAGMFIAALCGAFN